MAQTADALRAASKQRADGLPVTGGAGWASVAAAKAAGAAWVAFLPRLAGEVGKLATDLQEASTAYEQSDQAAGNRLGGPR